MRRALPVLIAMLALPACMQQAPSPAAAVPAPVASPPLPADPPRHAPRRDVIFVPTPRPVVDAMLDLAGIGPDDVLYDLGSGDGRIPIAAAQRYGIRAVGVEIDPELVELARANARAAGVSDRVRFVERDMFLTDVREATVVTLFLLDRLNLQLRPKLLEELSPGARIVSHRFGMGAWVPDATREIGRDTVYLWRVPTREPEAAAEGAPPERVR